MANKHWIEDMHLKKGALHKDLGVPAGQKIPVKKEEEAAQGGGKTGRRARVALWLNKHRPK